MLKVYKTSQLFFFAECDDVKFIRRGGNFDLIITKIIKETTATYEWYIQIALWERNFIIEGNEKRLKRLWKVEGMSKKYFEREFWQEILG